MGDEPDSLIITRQRREDDVSPSLVELSLQPDGEGNVYMDQDRLLAFEKVLDDLSDASPDLLLITSGAQDQFCPGARVEEFEEIEEQPEAYRYARRGQSVFQELASLDTLTVTLVDGDCLGGGLEMALACDAIICVETPLLKLGLPEVNLGIIPGFGGTQRLPRKVGLQNALEMILTGRSKNPESAQKMGLVETLIPEEGAHNRAFSIVNRWFEEGVEYRDSAGFFQSLLDDTGPGQSLVFNRARKRTKEKSGGHYPAPMVAIEAMEEGIDQPLEKGLEIEANKVSELVDREETRNLLHVYLESEQLKKIDTEKEIQPERGGVVGAGTMGGSIAQLFAYNGWACRMRDINGSALQAGMHRAREVFEEGRDRGKFGKEFLEQRMKLISPTLSWAGFHRTSVVIEAVPEKPELKKNVLQDIEDNVSRDTLIATNTSSIPLTELKGCLEHPDRFLGMHFFNPVHKMPLMEVIYHGETSPVALDRARQIAVNLGKTPIPVGDGPGFLVNRLLYFYLQEAMVLFREGGNIQEIDHIMKEFGMPQGPFEVLDQVGLDVAAHVSETLRDAFGERAESLQILDRLTDKNHLGKKTGKGFYIYQESGKSVNQEIDEVSNRSGRSPSRETEMKDRMVLSLINEGVRVLNEGLVGSPGALDAAMVNGTGFAPFRGGPWQYARQRGWSNVRKKLIQFRNKFGERFKIAEPFPEDENDTSFGDPPEELYDQDPEDLDETTLRIKSREKTWAPPDTALVFAGGGARGSYEAGVLKGLQKYVFPELPEPPNIDVLVGTSAGAVNAFYLAGCLDHPSTGIDDMIDIWEGLTLSDSLNLNNAGRLSTFRWLIGGRRKNRIGLLNPEYIRNLIESRFPWDRIRPAIEEGDLKALCVTATTLSDGRTTLFVDTTTGELPELPVDQNVRWQKTQIRPEHVYASASIPLLFPAARIDGTLYYDGGMRQNVPITPAICMDPEKVFVIGVKSPDPQLPKMNETSDDFYPGAPHIIGKIMDAILLDPVERERRRIAVLNDLIEEGRVTYGPEFADRVSDLLSKYVGGDLNKMDFYFHRPNDDLGALSRPFISEIANELGGIMGRIFHQFTSGQATGDWDLASYMLFDGRYTSILIRKGEEDIRKRADEIVDFFHDEHTGSGNLLLQQNTDV